MNQSPALLIEVRGTDGPVLGHQPSARLQPSSALQNAICGIRHSGQQCGLFAIEMPVYLMAHTWGESLMGIGNALEKDKSSPAIVILIDDMWRHKERAYLDKAVLGHVYPRRRNLRIYTEHSELSSGNWIELGIARCIQCHRPEGEPHLANCQIGKYTIRRVS